MPSKNKVRKTSSATVTTSECSKELRDLPEKDYRQLLASVAELPKKILTSESGGVTPGVGTDLTCGKEHEKLTPAAQSCLNKLVDEIKSGSTVVDQKIGKSATFDDSFTTRRIESFSAFSSTKKKPVRYEKEFMKFIDEGNDVEMVDLSGNSVATRTFTRGNHEHTATELTDNDIERAASQSTDGRLYGSFNDWNENSLLRNGRLLNRSQTILGPQSGGAFYPISKFIDGTDVIPILNPTYEAPPFSKPLLPTPLAQESLSNSSTNNGQSQPNGVSNNSEDAISKSNVQDVITPNTKSDFGKRKKNRKEKKESVMLAENVPGHMGQLPVEQLVHLIEGSNHSEQSSKKQSHKDKSSVVFDAPTIEEAAAIQPTKKERRRKSKELKETLSATNVVTIGAQQTKTGGSQAATITTTVTATATSLASALTTAQSPKMDFAVASNRMTPPGLEKRRGERGGLEANLRCSAEDGEEEFLSADEGIASSVGEESCALAVASMKKNPSSVRSASEIILDGCKYRADGEDLSQIERQHGDEHEFITVNTKKKKLNEVSGHQQRTGSAGKEERHHRGAEHLEPTRRSSMGIAPESRTSTQTNSVIPSSRRPTAASLADFLDGKDGGKIHSKTSSSLTISKSVKKSTRNERHNHVDVIEVSLPDMPAEKMSKSTHQGANNDSPERTFSYADAAKKSSEPSRDNSPACVAVASPSAKSDSPSPQTPTPVLCTSIEMCGTEVLPSPEVSSAVPAAAGGLSFFYDETEAALSREGNEVDVDASIDDAFVLHLGGKTVRFAKGMASSAVDVPPSNSHHMYLVEMLAQRWKMFQEGQVPQIYQPRIVSS